MSRSLVMQITFSVMIYFDFYLFRIFTLSPWTVLIRNSNLTDIFYDGYASPSMGYEIRDWIPVRP